MADYLTEAEAKRRYCPMMMAGPTGLSLCRASECMAWRLGPEDYVLVEGANKPEGDGWKESFRWGGATGTTKIPTWVKLKPPTGYCGLAGNPHPAYIVNTELR